MDYEAVDEVLVFAQGEDTKYIKVIINDDDNWEPDEDFYVQLYKPGTDNFELEGADTRTRVTIIDDDKPGQVCFEEKSIKALATEQFCMVKLIRKNGSDGVVTVDYETIQLDESSHTATPGVDFHHTSGTVTFQHQIASAEIKIEIIQKPDEVRDESFGIRLSNIFP